MDSLLTYFFPDKNSIMDWMEQEVGESINYAIVVRLHGGEFLAVRPIHDGVARYSFWGDLPDELQQEVFSFLKVQGVREVGFLQQIEKADSGFMVFCTEKVVFQEHSFGEPEM